MKISHENPGEQASAMDNYYKFQSKIYDMTRWTFLFGRDEIIKAIPLERNAKIKILSNMNLIEAMQLREYSKERECSINEMT